MWGLDGAQLMRISPGDLAVLPTRAILPGRPTGLVAGVGDKTAAGLLQKYGDLDGILAGAADPASSMASGLRGKLVAAASYLEVAPTVVAVARDVQVEPFDSKLRALDDDMRATVEGAGEQWGLGGSVTRVLAALVAATA